ncbi:MAG: hypothetical protein JSC189_000582 [Candidatus Tokpelaia sp. JSC189]|nr:MAG: hypothetical protein JSC189_000582 [Candidatus Tokpelaia sp. JSC189]
MNFDSCIKTAYLNLFFQIKLHRKEIFELNGIDINLNISCSCNRKKQFNNHYLCFCVKSAANCSFIAQANSSTSTIVTARR